ncbi:hypothetical protein FOZ63_024362 [Perkinsus olseni]|uniref:Menorin-like domain-containing protein n=1 Tax=Perkinsus olseni TaxID=32597 RepID=A0A7J6S760_PEROL|nr:hypothetical protein FOZ60_015876 [Perkinsus olseni]KAF4707392.1 hypothetical protein FOZ63_024362 [Perkinsus olseni]KAF4728768.1 hypothetical protein FOZ62_023093 [Perkinsus olseni]
MWTAANVGKLMVGLSSYVNDLCQRLHIPEPSALTWAHAVDSQAELEAADAMFYESDAGALAEDGRVIMCHYPSQTTSDLYLDQLLSAVEERKTGLKIDIKLDKLVAPIGNLLSKVKPDVPVWWNADVFGEEKLPLKALADVATKDTVLSLGYIGTGFGEAERKDIIKQLTEFGLLSAPSGEVACRHITFAFSARLALSCTAELVKLLEALPSTSLTLWTGATDLIGLSVPEELQLRNALPMSRVFLDIKPQTWLGWLISWLQWTLFRPLRSAIDYFVDPHLEVVQA